MSTKYSLLQFGYWFDYLVIASFAAVLLAGRGFTASEIGYVTTVGSVMTMFLQTALGSLADKSKKITVKMILFALIVLGIGVAMIMWMIPKSYVVSFVCMFTALSLYNTMSPMLTSLCLKLNKSGHNINFGVARSLGSLGYAIAGFIMGSVTERFGVEIVLPIYAVIAGCMLILLFTMKEQNSSEEAAADVKKNAPEEQPKSLLQFFKAYKQYDMFIISIMLMFFMQMITNTYMIYFVRNYGGDTQEMGLALSLCAFAEMPAIFLGTTLMRKFSAQNMLRVCGIGGLAKFALMLIIPNAGWFIGIHALHFFYSGMYMVAAVYFADSIVGKADSVKGQTIMAVSIAGVTGIIANIVGGYMLENLPIKVVMTLGVITSTLGAILMFFATSRKRWATE